MGLFRTRTHEHTGTHQERSRTVTLASATLITRDQIRRVVRKQSWQQEAWELYEDVPEVRFISRWLGNALSRCHLYIGEPEPEGGGDPSPMDDPGPAADILAELHEGQVGQGSMLKRFGVHLSVVAETYLIGVDPDPDDPDGRRRWLVASTDEFSSHGGKARVLLPETGEPLDLDPDNATIIRIWEPHPRRAWEADSPIRSGRGILNQIKGLSRRVQADIDSRLAGAGLLVLPHSASMPNPAQSESDGVNPLHEDPIVAGLMQGMVTPIQDPEDASAVVPLVLKVDDEAVGKIQHISFSTAFDAKITDLMSAALQRYAGTSDLPGEILQGLGDSNHWSAWSISEQALKMHVEPLLACICDALTQQYLWPSLRAAGITDPEQYVVWFDSSELSQRPDRSKEAQALWDQGELSGEALLRENGFGPEDAPDDQERLRWLAIRLVQKQPALLPALAKDLGMPELADVQVITPPGQTNIGNPAVPAQPSPAGLPSGSRPEIPQQPAAPADVAASSAYPAVLDGKLRAFEVLILRALDIAGKRILTQHSRTGRHRGEKARQVHTWDIHSVMPRPRNREVNDLLKGAFDLLEATMPDEPCYREVADTYCTTLIASGQPHRREYLLETLHAAGCLTP